MVFVLNDNHYIFSKSNHVPGQAFVLQSTVTVFEPVQSLPPPDGAGLLHVLVLDFCPVPHVLVHVEYAPHAVHIPFTKNRVLTTIKVN